MEEGPPRGGSDSLDKAKTKNARSSKGTAGGASDSSPAPPRGPGTEKQPSRMQAGSQMTGNRRGTWEVRWAMEEVEGGGGKRYEG